MPLRTKRALLVAASMLVAAALAVVPWQARAGTQATNGIGFLSANLSFVVTQSISGANSTFTVRVLNNGPDDLADGDYQIVFDWSVGSVVPRAGDTPCVEVSANGCVLDGREVEFFEGPISGPGSVDFRLTVTGITNGFFLDVREINYSQDDDPFPPFGITPPLFCTTRSCGAV